MHERVGDRLADRFAWIVGHVLSECAFDHGSGTHVLGDGVQGILDHERNRTDDGLRVEESAVLVHRFGFGDAWKSGEGDIEPRKELLGERAESQQTSERWSDGSRVVLFRDVHADGDVLIVARAENAWMQLPLACDELGKQIGIQVIQGGLRNDFVVECGLTVFFHKTVDLVLGEFAITIAGADV